MAVCFTTVQVLEQIFSSVHQEEDYSDSKEEEEDVLEDEDGEEYNPECKADNASRSSEEDQEEDQEGDQEEEPEEEIAAAQAERETLLPKMSKSNGPPWPIAVTGPV